VRREPERDRQYRQRRGGRARRPEQEQRLLERLEDDARDKRAWSQLHSM
jgi:hypothetical protein